MALGDRKKAKDAGISVDEMRLRTEADKTGRSYDELREQVSRRTVEKSRASAERHSKSPTWGANPIERQYAEAMGISVDDLFTRWDFDRKTLLGAARQPVKASFGPFEIRGGDPPTLHGPRPSGGGDGSWKLGTGTTATVDASGSVAVTRGRNLAAKAVGGLLVPGGVFLFGNARERQHDHRELSLTVTGPGWAEAWAIHPDLAAEARRFAAQIIASSPARPSSPPRGDDVIDRLERLQALHAAGALTDEEFAAQKARVLAE